MNEIQQLRARVKAQTYLIRILLRIVANQTDNPQAFVRNLLEGASEHDDLVLIELMDILEDLP